MQRKMTAECPFSWVPKSIYMYMIWTATINIYSILAYDDDLESSMIFCDDSDPMATKWWSVLSVKTWLRFYHWSFFDFQDSSARFLACIWP